MMPSMTMSKNNKIEIIFVLHHIHPSHPLHHWRSSASASQESRWIQERSKRKVVVAKPLLSPRTHLGLLALRICHASVASSDGRRRRRRSSASPLLGWNVQDRPLGRIVGSNGFLGHYGGERRWRWWLWVFGEPGWLCCFGGGEGSGGGRGSKQLNAPYGLVQGNKTVSWLVAPTSFFFISILVTLNTS